MSLLQRAVPVVVSVGVLAWLFGSVDRNALVAALSWRVAGVMIPALLAYGAATLVLEAVSIIRLIEARPAGFSAWTAARIKCASYLLGIVNYALGAGALALLLRRRTQLPLGEAASLVLLISSVDLVVVLALAGTAAALVETNAPTVRAGALVGALVGFFGGLVLLRAPRSLGPLERLRSLAIFRALRTVSLRRLAELLAMRTCFTSSFVALFAATFFAFEVTPPLGELVVGTLVVGVVAGIPIAVAGLGTSQATFLYVFAPYASQEVLLAQSLVLSAGMLCLRGLMGMLFAREFTREALRETRGAEA